MSYICPICLQGWKSGQRSIQCSACLCWIHHSGKKKCSGLTNTEFALHCNDDSKQWECDKCISKCFLFLPFLDDDKDSFCLDNLDSQNYNKNQNYLSDDVNMQISDENKKFVTQCDSVPNLIDDDDDDKDLQNTIHSKYYDIDQLNSLKIDSPSSFGLFHVNIASLDKHIDDLKLILSLINHNFDILGISEHKILKDSLPSNNIKIPGYKDFIFEPSQTVCGGTGFYIKDNLDHTSRSDLQINSPSHYESIFIEIEFHNKKNLIFGCFYRHPSSNISIEEFTNEHLDPVLQKISMENKQCVIMGDFNINLLKIDTNRYANLFFNTMSSNFFTPFILQPSRLQSKTLIDNIFFNSIEYQTNSGNILIEISDHLIQFLILEGYSKEKTLPDVNIMKRDFRNFNEREFSESLDIMDWNKICNLELNDPNLSCKNFIDGITYLLDEFAPYKKVTKKELKLMTKPWISKDILKKCKDRDSILKQISKENNTINKINLRNEYKTLRNEITKNKRDNKKAYYTIYFEKNKNKSSKIWKGIRDLVNLKPAKSSNIKLMNENNNLVTNPSIISNIFNDHFSTIGAKIEQKIPVTQGNFKDYFDKKDKNGELCISSPNSIFFSPTLPLEIEKIINNLDTKKATGPNSIPLVILKTFKYFFSFWLSKLVNQCFLIGIFPDILKIAKVTPLHKKESKLNYLNYRPISLLSVFNKIYEKLIYSRSYHFLNQNKLINSNQFGFRSNHSTNHALLNLTERIKSLVDTGKYVCGIFIDLEKAFDTVNHKILCEKLNYYGFRGKVNNLFESYLSNRKQYVSINGYDSVTKDLNCGVPQGSSLGPLLFLIYINDFKLCLNECDSGHFADDTFIMYSNTKLKSIETIINTELKEVSKWLRLNKLSPNTNKTELIFFHSRQHLMNYEDISIKFNGIKLLPVDHVKYLGMYIDKYLSWNFHIAHLSKKLSRANGILSKLRHNASMETCLQVYYAIFHSHLIYSCNIWGLTLEENIKKIEVLQKKCLRIMTFSEFNCHTTPLFINLKLLKIPDFIKIQQLKLVYSFYSNMLPCGLKPLFKLNSDIHDYATKSVSQNLLHIPRINTSTYGTKSIRYTGPILWNFLAINGIAIDNNLINNINIDQIHNGFQLSRILKKSILDDYSLN